MATVLESYSEKKSSTSEAYLQRKFAELCARVKRADVLAHLLVLGLLVLVYAFAVALFDWFAGNSTTDAVVFTRWIAFAAFSVAAIVILLQTVRCGLRRISPYFVAHQLERAMPDAKNCLVNWLDMQGEEIPAAFQNNLADRAAERLEECDTDAVLKCKNNRTLFGVLALPAVGLLVMLVLLGPAAFFASMLRAFVPFYTPPPIARTQITLVQPTGDAEVLAGQAITFVAKVEGRATDVPKLLYRYQASEDYLTQPLKADDAGHWTTQLQPAQIRAGFLYKVSADDAETPEHQVRVRARAHVEKYVVKYHHKPYRKLPPEIRTFTNGRPEIRGPIGTTVEVIAYSSGPIKNGTIEIAGGKRRLPEIIKLKERFFTSLWVLDRPGQFRIVFTTTDGEENSDRDWYPIDVPADAEPKVVLTVPGKDVNLAVNDTLVLEGEAISNVGIRAVNLRLRVANDRPATDAQPIEYRNGELRFDFDDGTYPGMVPYLEVVAMDQLKTGAGEPARLKVGDVIEYWLEAADCSHFPNQNGNVGKSPVYKVTLTDAPTKPQAIKQQTDKRNQATARKQQHDKQQNQKHAQENQTRKENGNGGGQSNPQNDVNEASKEKKDTEDKIKQAMKEKADGQGKGKTKPGDDSNASAKDGPPDGDSQPKPKDNPPESPGDSGGAKDKGDMNGSSGGAKDDGDAKRKSGDGASKGDRKDGPKDTGSQAKDAGQMAKPDSGAKDGGPMGMDTPMPTQAKEPAPDGSEPATTAKGVKGEPQPQSDVKGIEKNGPDTQAAKAGAEPPPTASKGSMMNDGAGDAKNGPPDADKHGKPRGDDAKADAKEPSWDDLAKLLKDIGGHDAKGDEAGRAIAEIAKEANDPAKRDLAMEILKKNGRDPKTGKEEKKAPNSGASGGKSPGISDNVKTAAVNREFAARIGQMQLDDWKKRMTPDLLKKAGLTDAEWQRYLKLAKDHDSAVRRLNAKLLQDALKKELRGAANPNAGLREVENTGVGSGAVDGNRGLAPPELRPAIRELERLMKRSP